MAIRHDASQDVNTGACGGVRAAAVRDCGETAMALC